MYKLKKKAINGNTLTTGTFNHISYLFSKTSASYFESYTSPSFLHIIAKNDA